MTTLFNALLFVIDLLIISFYIIKSYNMNDEVGKRLGRVFIGCFCVVITYGLTFLIHVPIVMSVLHSLYFISIDWMLWFLILFVDYYIKHPVNKVLHHITVIYLIFDTVILTINPWTNIAMGYTVIQFHGYEILDYIPKVLYNMHLLFDYIIIIYMMHNLVEQAVKLPAHYKMKPIMLVCTMGSVIIVNSLFILLNRTPVDYSVFIYGIGVIVTYHFIKEYIPAKLVSEVKSVVDDSLYDATAVYDMEGRLLTSNAVAKEIFELSENDDLERLLRYLGDFHDGDELEFDGKYFEIHRLDSYDDHGLLIASAFVGHDVTLRRKSMEEVHRMAIYDALTESYNKNGFMSACRECDTLNKSALVVLGVQNFKGVNNLYGNVFGDKVLKSVASELKEFHKMFGIIYGRTAEGKFAILVKKEFVKDFLYHFEYINVHLSDSVEIRMNLYLGYTYVTGDVILERVYEQSNMAASRAKEKFTSRIVEYTEELDRDLMYKQSLVMDLERAIEENEFFFVIQPLIDAKSKKVHGGEALARWKHHKYGLISPVTFIPLFEENGFIARLDVNIWEQVIATLRQMQDEDQYHGYLSINVSQIDVESLHVVDILNDLCAKYSVEHEFIHVEITESILAADAAGFKRTMQDLANEGYVIVIDDFGSGYSFLNMMSDMDFDEIKMDMKFMIHASSHKSSIVIPAIAHMIHELGCTLVIEGVETEEQEEMALKAEGDIFQGFLYSKPIAVEDFREYVKEHS